MTTNVILWPQVICPRVPLHVQTQKVLVYTDSPLCQKSFNFPHEKSLLQA